jgi:uncharacterized membrane protein
MFACISYESKVLPYLADKNVNLLLSAAFLLMGLARFFRVLGDRYRISDTRRKTLDFVSGAVFIVCALLLLVNGRSPWTHQAACVVFLFSFLVGRVLAVVHDHGKANVILNTATASLVIYYTFYLWNPGTAWIGWVTTMTVAAFTALLNIFSVVFSHIRIDILKEILQKTYAAEILFGLVLLVLALGYWLYASEQGITSYADALWYCFALVTTIGLGDIAAVSMEGRVISVILGAYGIIVVALITSIIVNYYGETKKTDSEKQDQTK